MIDADLNPFGKDQPDPIINYELVKLHGISHYLKENSAIAVDFPNTRIVVTRCEPYNPASPMASMKVGFKSDAEASIGAIGGKSADRSPASGGGIFAQFAIANALGDKSYYQRMLEDGRPISQSEQLERIVSKQRYLNDIQKALEGVSRMNVNTVHFALKAFERRAKAASLVRR